MKNIKVSTTMLCVLIVFAAAVLSGCTGARAIDSRKLKVTAKMSDTIFLDPEMLEKNNSVYVRVTNTSDFQEIDFGELVRVKIASKGYTITNKPSQAGYMIQANLLYMGAERDTMTQEGMLVGGFGGALAGSQIGHGSGSIAAGTAGAVVGSIVGGLLGSMAGIDTYLGSVDIQLKEKVDGGVSGTMNTNAKQGSSTTFSTTRDIKSSFQEYRTRIVVKAEQTNINRQEACQVIMNRLAVQVAGMF